ncbi:MAG: glycosyltransferase family 39 protein [Caldilineaceae bacterium]|nr:glycosyltransferase family 39 protein [Caldilineaceae bacterium]
MSRAAAAHGTESPRRERWYWIALAGIVLASVLGNLYWLRQNIVLVGRDSTGHLERTLKAAEVLTHVNPSSLFAALTIHDYRPPLLYVAAQPFYRLFGISLDSAQLTNVFFFALVIILTYVLGRRVTSPGAALFAALLVSLLPMPVAMARLFYMEHLLTTVLLVNMLALLEAQRFQRRGWSIVWGATVGLGLLVKWTFPIYIVLPVLYVLWRGGLLDWRQYRPHGIRLDWRRVGWAFLGGALFLAFWYWPNRAVIGELLLGPAIPVLWFVLAAGAIYLLTGPDAPRHNFWGATVLALCVAAIWYLPRADFVTRLSEVAFGTDRGNQESFDLLNLANYTRYFQFWVTYHMGLLPTLLILPIAIWGWVKRFPVWRRTQRPFLLLLLMPLSTMAVLIWLAQANPRNLVPIVPVMALLLADALLAYPRRVAVAIGAVWTVVLAFQWALFTFDGLAPVHAASAPLWVVEDYSAWPATGNTDPGYWIQPDVLDAIGSPQGEPATFGMLVDTWEIHRGSFRYLIAAEGRNVELMSLTEPEGRGWSDMLANQWILIKDGDNAEVREPGLSVVKRILAGDPLFHALYHEVRRYTLPDGDTVYLYHRPEGPPNPYAFPVVLIDTAGVAEAVNAWTGPETTVFLSTPDTATWVGIHDLTARTVLVGDGTAATMDRLLRDRTGTIIAVTRYDTPEVQDYLRARADYGAEFTAGEFTATLFGRPERALAPLDLAGTWDEVTIDGGRGLATVAPGALLPLEFDVSGRVDGTLKFSFRLVAPDGTVVAQRDEVAQSTVRTALFVPPTAAPGTYTLAAVLYDPADLTPIPDTTGETEPVLGEIAVE